MVHYDLQTMFIVSARLVNSNTSSWRQRDLHNDSESTNVLQSWVWQYSGNISFQLFNRLIWIQTHSLCGCKIPVGSFSWLNFTFVIHLSACWAVIGETDFHYGYQEVGCAVFCLIKSVWQAVKYASEGACKRRNLQVSRFLSSLFFLSSNTFIYIIILSPRQCHIHTCTVHIHTGTPHIHG